MFLSRFFQFTRWIVVGVAMLVGSSNILADSGPRPKRILVKSSWQSVNIGDIAHSPGLLHLLKSAMPQAQITLWAGNLDHGAREMLQRNFPDVTLFVDEETPENLPVSEAGQKLWKEADFFIHGSGPGLAGGAALAAWAKTGRPYGVYGVTLDHFDSAMVSLLNRAKFVFCRESRSLDEARANGVTTEYLEFAPDAAFAALDRNDEEATKFLKANGLERGKFIVVVSRLRYTPYDEVYGKAATERDLRRHAMNRVTRDSDQERVRQIIVEWVRKTGMKVLLCPEMTYEVGMTRKDILERLPDDVRKQVVWRSTYWCSDEAVSVYAQAMAMVSMEMHSPILAVGVGTPAIYLRLPTDTWKGEMWRDIGLPEWIFELEHSDGSDVAQALFKMIDEPRRTARRVDQARSLLKFRQQDSMEIVRAAVCGEREKRSAD